jgi:RNA polymerase sigma-70 factor, ECF subfamily
VPPSLPPSGSDSRDDESECILLAQAGDRPAFARLVDRYWERLFRWLCRLTRDPSIAEDLAQETFLKAFANVNRFQAGSNFRAWLFRIGHNNFVNQRRSTRHDRAPVMPDLAEDDCDPANEMVTRETVLAVNEAIGRLPPDFRHALLLRVEEDLSFREIADVLEITEETARWRVFKARQKLLTLLSPDLVPTERKTP